MFLISGEGRSGTTLLLQFLNLLGFDTGGGVEGPHEFLKERNFTNFPDVIKHLGGFCVNLEHWVTTYDWDVEHLFYVANTSEVMVSKRLPGGIPHNSSKILNIAIDTFAQMNEASQREAIQKHYYERLAQAAYGAADLGIPFSVICYQQFCSSADYAIEVLRPVLRSASEIRRVHSELIDMSRVRQ